MICVIQFPGTTCDRETMAALEVLRPGQVRLHWHELAELPAEVTLVVLPGGFSFGDYLRAGALAARSPAMGSVVRYANRGGWVLGICNGFQILTEAGLLPGALVRNRDLHFVCDTVGLEVADGPPALLAALPPGQRLRLPIAHRDGCFVASPELLASLSSNHQVLLRYCDAGQAGPGNPNGSADAIAGICSANRRVLGLMPHPERAFAPWHGSSDGKRWLEALFQAIDATGGLPPPG